MNKALRRHNNVSAHGTGLLAQAMGSRTELVGALDRMLVHLGLLTDTSETALKQTAAQYERTDRNAVARPALFSNRRALLPLGVGGRRRVGLKKFNVGGHYRGDLLIGGVEEHHRRAFGNADARQVDAVPTGFAPGKTNADPVLGISDISDTDPAAICRWARDIDVRRQRVANL
jgi:hypothetical protein